MNLQIDVEAVAPIIEKLDQAGFSLYRECKDTWYQAENVDQSSSADCWVFGGHEPYGGELPEVLLLLSSG